MQPTQSQLMRLRGMLSLMVARLTLTTPTLAQLAVSRVTLVLKLKFALALLVTRRALRATHCLSATSRSVLTKTPSAMSSRKRVISWGSVFRLTLILAVLRDMDMFSFPLWMRLARLWQICKELSWPVALCVSTSALLVPTMAVIAVAVVALAVAVDEAAAVVVEAVEVEVVVDLVVDSVVVEAAPTGAALATSLVRRRLLTNELLS